MKKSVPELGGSDLDEESLGSLGSEKEDGDDDTIKLGDPAGSDSSGGSEMDFLEDENDIITDEGGDPTGLVAFSSGSSDEDSDAEADGDEWQGFGSDVKTRKRGRNKEAAERKKKRRKLATFASYEDYAAMIEKSQEDNI